MAFDIQPEERCQESVKCVGKSLFLVTMYLTRIIKPNAVSCLTFSGSRLTTVVQTAGCWSAHAVFAAGGLQKRSNYCLLSPERDSVPCSALEFREISESTGLP